MHVILDRGHGFDTKGKRSKVWPNGKQLIEWEFNEKVRAKVAEWLTLNPHLFTFELFPKTKKDIHRSVRKKYYERKAQILEDDVLMLSIHGDAFESETARGGTCFTSPGWTKSDVCAKCFKEAFEYYKLPVRTSKEAKYTVLMGMGYSGVLLEMGFYTNYKECMFMLSDEGVNTYANVIIRGLNEIYAIINKNY